MSLERQLDGKPQTHLRNVLTIEIRELASTLEIVLDPRRAPQCVTRATLREDLAVIEPSSCSVEEAMEHLDVQFMTGTLERRGDELAVELTARITTTKHGSTQQGNATWKGVLRR